VRDGEIAAIGYSAYPRDVEGSYMPCFLVGEAISGMLSAFYKVPLYRFSHQSGHIRAAVYSSNASVKDEFIAFHVSGGTTEVVKVKCENNYYKTEIIGGSNDLHAGQAIDRIGVHLGFKFPCGKEIEQYAKENSKEIPPFATSVKGYSCNLSGLENLALGLYKKTQDKALTSAFVLDFIGKTLEKITVNLRKEFPTHKIVYGGGVLSNSIIKARLNKKFKEVYFAEPHKPWQRGTNENTNDILRFFFPKGFDFRSISQDDVDVVVELINNRPRKCLNWHTPAEIFLQKSVALA
jgi:N6-L-threonylcarbamoyladenine synthase